MPLNDIIFVKGQGGLGRPLTGEDHISGIAFYGVDAYPSGFSDNPYQVVYSISGAEALGIVADCSDAASAVGTITVDTLGVDGDKVTVKIGEPQGAVVTLASYTKVSGDSTKELVATAITALINANTRTHGYVAVADGSGVDITAPKKLGVYLNGTACTVTNVGTIVVSGAPFSGGWASELAVQHYHIAEYFRIQPKGVLWIAMSTSAPTDYSEVSFLQTTSGGKIRQVAVYRMVSSTTGDLETIQAMCDTLDDTHMPISSVVVGSNRVEEDLETLADLGELNAPKVSVVIGQDFNGLGGYLFYTSQYSITCAGAVLGAISLATVSQDIAWKGKFDLSNGFELDTIGFANGQPSVFVTPNLISTLCDKRYIFLVKNIGSAGTYINDSYTAITETSDYCFIENNRTIDKAIRGAYASLLPEIGAPIQLNADGTISDVTINHLKSVAAPNLDQMVRDSDLSNYSVDINPTQDVLATSKIIVSINLLPKGVSRVIQVNIGFVKSI